MTTDTAIAIMRAVTSGLAILCSGLAASKALGPVWTGYLTTGATALLAINHLLPREAAKETT